MTRNDHSLLAGLPLAGSRRDSPARRATAGDERRPCGRSLLVRLPALVLLGLIRLYQRTLSPALPVLTLGACACRFAPTCSHYALEAIRTHGAVRGGWLALRRLLKCTPLHPGGLDPVPPARPICRRSASNVPVSASL